MGGDFAPHNVVQGAIDALRESNNRFDVLLIGPESILQDEVHELAGNGLTYRIVDAPQVITMDDGATAAVKQKKDST